MDLPAYTRGSAFGRHPVPAFASPGQEGELAWRPASRPGPHSRPGGHCGPALGGGGEVPGRGLGTGYNHRLEAPGALITSVDRGSKYTVLERIDVNTAVAVTETLTQRMGPLRDLVHTLRADNGKEFAGHRAVSGALAADFHFATPYHSWERGLNEHTNGLVRQYFPKGTDFRMVTESQVRAVEERINHRPRKVLGYRTPAEVFTGALVPP